MNITAKIIYCVFTSLALECLALLPHAKAVSPPPDGGYPGQNTAEGQDALLSLSTGQLNTAIGRYSLSAVTSGSYNTGVGAGTLALNTGNTNTASGTAALLLNTTGASNTANGVGALLHNTTGNDNTAIGQGAMEANTDGCGHVAVGLNALTVATAGCTIFAANTAVGTDALVSNSTGNGNTGIGFATLIGNTTGAFNTAIGNGAGSALTTGDNNIDIGNGGVAGESNTIRIGVQGTHTATYMAGLYLTVLPISVPVAITPDGQLGEPSVSSARFKDDIKRMDKTSEAIFALKPITFHYKKEIDPKRIAQFGLVAEEVEKVDPALITRDREGKPYTVRYEAVNAMLLNEFLKEHRKVQELEARLAQQERNFSARLKEEDAKIQKVSDSIQLSKATSQTADNR